MAANSIAKLAVIITGDTGGLNTAMGQATERTRQFASEAAHAGNEGLLGALAGSLKIGVQGMHAFEGSTRGIIHTLHNLAGPGGIALVAAAGFAFLGYEALKAADHAAEARNKIREDFDKAFQDLHGVSSGVQQEDTIGGAWKEIKEAAEDFFATVAENTGLVEALVGMFKSIAESIKEWAEYFKTDIQRAQERNTEALKKQTEQLKEAKKQRDENQKKAEEAEKAIQRQLEETRRRAEQVTKSLRVPDEIYRDTIIELKSLAAQGLITGETLERGMARARGELQKALDVTKEGRESADQRVAAVEKGTAAGYSAIQQYNRSQADEARKAAQITAKNSDFLKHLESIDKTLSDMPKAPAFQLSNL